MKQNKWNTDSFISAAKIIHNNKYDYSNLIYKNTSTKVCIICPEHGEFWVLPRHHLNGVGCASCKGVKRLDTAEFIRRAKLKHGDKYDYSKVNYINKNTKVTIICPKHGEFEQKAEDHYRGRGCWKCWFDKHTELQTYTYEQWLLKARCKYGWKFDYSKIEWRGYNEPIKIICPDHGEFITTPHNHLWCATGCPKCGRETANNSNSLSQEEFLQKAVQIHPEYDYSKTVFTRTRNNVIIGCPKHGEVRVKASGLIYMGFSCPKCILKSQGILQKRIQDKFPNMFLLWEYHPNWLCGQRIDIADDIYRIGIEYDGIQHFQPVEHFGGDAVFTNQQLSDKLKNDRCIDNNFHLFRVPYNYDDEFFEDLCSKIQEIIDNTGQITEENGNSDSDNRQ